MELSKHNSRSNVQSFLWHAAFLALAANFMDVNTIIPSMLIKAGGTAFHLGLLTAIMLGGTRIFQLIFASGLSSEVHKKRHLLWAIEIRVISLIAMAVVFYYSPSISGNIIIFVIFVLMTIFSLSGSYAGIPYNDIFGKSVLQTSRKRFYSLKQIINSIGVFLSAILVRDLIKRFGYPGNYALLFMCAGILLFIASLGFWNIKEIPSKVDHRRSLLDFLRHIPSEIRKNPNLKNYLFIINSLGLGVSILPFLILYAKENFGLSFSLIGNLLLYRTIGMLFASILFYKIAPKTNYKKLMIFSLILGASLPVIALFLSNNQFLYQLLFILSGVFLALYRISDNGVLLEISTNENRVLYTGISGAGSLLTAIFPLLAGFLISKLGYIAVFSSVSILIILSFFFVNKLNCQKNDK